MFVIAALLCFRIALLQALGATERVCRRTRICFSASLSHIVRFRCRLVQKRPPSSLLGAVGGHVRPGGGGVEQAGEEALRDLRAEDRGGRRFGALVAQGLEQA
eukprot:8010745-Alexandrium_andersonii.AAC.1